MLLSDSKCLKIYKNDSNVSNIWLGDVVMPYTYVNAGSSVIKCLSGETWGELNEPVIEDTEMFLADTRNSLMCFPGEIRAILRTDKHPGFRYVSDVVRTMMSTETVGGRYEFSWTSLVVMLHGIDDILKRAYDQDELGEFVLSLTGQLEFLGKMREKLWSRQCFIERVSNKHRPCTYGDCGTVQYVRGEFEIQVIKNIILAAKSNPEIAMELSNLWRDTQMALPDLASLTWNEGYFAILNMGDELLPEYGRLLVLQQDGSHQEVLASDLIDIGHNCVTHVIGLSRAIDTITADSEDCNTVKLTLRQDGPKVFDSEYTT